MYIKSIYNTQLSQISYYIESNGEAAVIDPVRRIDTYLELINKRKSLLKFIFNTHLHSDFVSGNYHLQKQTEAVSVFGPNSKLGYHVFVANDEEEFVLGKLRIKILHTPGHTIESSCFLVINEVGEAISIFTGDTLLVGDVGRPDLMSGNLSKEILSEKLYESVNRIMNLLSDDVVLYPGHYGGTFCGKVMTYEKSSTIGAQRVLNKAYLQSDKPNFVKYVTNDLPYCPAYFFKVSQINRQKCSSVEEIIQRNFKPLDTDDFLIEMSAGAVVLDYRPSEVFAEQHIPGSINIELATEFLCWVGVLIPINKKLLLVGDTDKVKEVITLLAEIGYENVLGFLEDGLRSWDFLDHHRLASIKSTTISEARKIFYPDKFVLIDVRDYEEVRKEKIFGSINIPLIQLNDIAEHLDKNANYVVYCYSGYRSMIACSILQAKGYKNLLNVYGGINLVKNTNPELIETNGK